MKSLFYGGAIAAMSGLLMGAGLKAPLAAEDFEPMDAIAGQFETADVSGYDSGPQYAAPQYAALAYYVPAADYSALEAAEEPAAELTPAVYTEETETPAPVAATAPVYQLAAAEPVDMPANVIRSTDAAAEPDVVGRSQGFEMVEAPATDMF